MAKSTKQVLNSYKKQYNKSQKDWKRKTGFPVNKKKNFYDKYTRPTKPYKSKKTKNLNVKTFENTTIKSEKNNNGCYIATCVYGSYDCPEVWTLRRFRDNILKKTWYGRLFIKFYYTTSPSLVKWFGYQNWFLAFWKKLLNNMVVKLNNYGIENTKYKDIY